MLPTICGLAGIPVPDDVEGVDLSPQIQGDGGGPDTSLMMGCGATADWIDGHEWRAARNGRYTYARYRIDGSELLFDRDADPWQMTNLADDPAFADIKARLKTWLAQKMAAIADEFHASSFYRDHWTDGNRCIIRSATAEFGPAVPPINNPTESAR